MVGCLGRYVPICVVLSFGCVTYGMVLVPSTAFAGHRTTLNVSRVRNANPPPTSTFTLTWDPPPAGDGSVHRLVEYDPSGRGRDIMNCGCGSCPPVTLTRATGLWHYRLIYGGLQ